MTFNAAKIADGVYWVGCIDWNIRNFHGYLTPRGTTYNAYLVVDEKIALIDTAKNPFSEELLARVSSVIDPASLDFIVANHVEMDHSGSLTAVKKAAPNAALVADKRAAQDINRHFKQAWEFKTVKTGDVLNLGKRNLTFVEVPMVHWPDSMVTFCPEEKLLFSNDAFGQHIASTERFDDQFPPDEVTLEAKKYYANIVMPFAVPVCKALEAVSKLDVRTIAPSHGVIWRTRVSEIVSRYRDWSANKTTVKAVLVYDTMWNSTEMMAKALAEGISKDGAKCLLFNLRTSDISAIMQEILDASHIIVGSPTLNNGMLPTVNGFLTYLKGLKPKGRKGFAFGSFGWSGGGAKAVESELAACGVELINPAIEFKYVPDNEELAKCFEIGGRLFQKD